MSFGGFDLTLGGGRHGRQDEEEQQAERSLHQQLRHLLRQLTVEGSNRFCKVDGWGARIL